MSKEEEKAPTFWEKINKDISFGNPLNDKTKEHLYTELSALLDAGIDIQRALEILIEEQTKKTTREILETIKSDLIKGMSLSNALEKSGKFSPYEYQSIRIGEESGKLKLVLTYLTHYFEDKVKLKKQLISVFTYPAFVLLITFGVLYFMLGTVVPMFQDVFKQFGQDLPWLTKKIIIVSDNFSTILFVFFGFIAILLAVRYYQKNEVWYRNISSKIILKIPVFGVLFKKIYLARFCQSMSLLTASKTPLVKSLELVKDMIRFYPIEVALDSATKEIIKGNSLHEGLSKFPIFDRRIISLIKIAEEINQLDTTFERLSKQLNDDVEYRTKLLGTIIEPIIILLIGAIVGVIMIAMYLPMFNLSNVIK